MIFDKDNRKTTGKELVPEGKCIKDNTLVHVHVQTFDTPLNVGCGFDALKFPISLEEVPVVDAGGTVSASVFDQFGDDSSQPADWNVEKN